jgi:hypothetical protein
MTNGFHPPKGSGDKKSEKEPKSNPKGKKAGSAK